MITDYASLKANIAAFLMRDDLTAAIPTFIQLAEANFNRVLRHYKMEKRSTAAFNEPFELLPSDFLEMIRLELSGAGPLEQVGPGEMMRLKATTQTGAPRVFKLTASEIELFPPPNGEAGTGQIVYFGRIPSLSDDAPTNWLLEDAPDLYLYGALVHSAPYLMDDARLAVWGGLHSEIVATMNAKSEQTRHSGPLRMRF